MVADRSLMRYMTRASHTLSARLWAGYSIRFYFWMRQPIRGAYDLGPCIRCKLQRILNEDLKKKTLSQGLRSCIGRPQGRPTFEGTPTTETWTINKNIHVLIIVSKTLTVLVEPSKQPSWKLLLGCRRVRSCRHFTVILTSRLLGLEMRFEQTTGFLRGS